MGVLLFILFCLISLYFGLCSEFGGLFLVITNSLEKQGDDVCFGWR